MALKFEITGDNRNFLQALDQSVNGVHRASREIEQSGMSIEDMFKRIAAAAGIAFSIDGAKSFLSQVVEMRSYFQDIESSMEVFLGSAEKGQKFMEELKAAAYYNMFEFTDLANASKQLIAYKNDIDTVIPTIQKLSDVAVGTSAPLLELVNLYNKAKSTGKVSTQDMYSWAVKGVVIKDVLKEMGEEATDTTVSFDQLNKVLDHITSEGGMFYQLQDKMMSNISAEIGQFQDNLALMLNEIGEKYQDEITGVIKIGSELIDNYQTIAGWIKDIVIAYGTYRAALAVCLAIDKAVVYWKGLEAEATMMNTLANTGETGSVTALTIAKIRLTSATKALTTAILANPYVLIAAGVATLTYAIYKLATAETDLEKAQEKVDESFENTLAEIKSEQTEIDRLFGKLRKAKEGTEEYKKTKDQIISQYGQYLQGLGNEISTLKDVEGAYKAVTKAAREASIARGKEAALKDVQDTYGKNYASSIEKLQSALNSRVGGKQATDALIKVQTELRKTGTISEQTEQQIKEMFRGTADYGNSGAWITGLRNNEKYLNDYTELVEQRFQFEEETEKKASDNKKKRDKQAIDDERKSLQSQLESLEQSEAVGKKGIELKKKIQALDKELKAYSATDKSGATASNDAAARRQRGFELDIKQIEEQAAQAQTTRNAIEQARIAAIKDDAERERATQDEQHRLTMQSIDNREEEMKKALYEYNKSVWENQNKKKNLKYSDTSEGAAGWENLALTKEQQDELKALRDKENSEYARLIQERYRAEAQAMRDFLSEYGTLEQRKLAITKEYEERISRASTQGEKMSLAKERDSKVSQINAQSLAMDIDWTQTFKGLGNILQDIAKETLSKVDKYMKTDEYKRLDANDKKAYQELRNDLIAAGGQESASPFSAKTWDDIAKYTEAYKQRVKDFMNASETHKDAIRRLEEAQNDLASATTDTGRLIAQQKVDLAQKAVDESAKTVDSTKSAKDEANDKVHKAADAAAKGLENFNTILNQLTSGTLTGFFNGVSNVIASITKKTSDDMEGIVGIIGKKAGGIVGAILSIIDALGDDPAKFVDDILDKVADVIKAVLEQLPQIIGSVVEGVGNIVGSVVTGLGNLISGGALWGNGNESEMEEEIARLSKANEGLAKSIETLSESISKSDSSNKESLDAYTKAIDAERQWEENQRRAIDDRAAEWTNTGYGFLGMGGKGSFNAHMAGNDWEGWKVFSDLLKERFGTGFGFEHKSVNSDTIWSLTPEEMRLLRDFAPKEWASLMNGDGHRNPSELIDEYIERAGELESLTEALNKKLTGYSWEGFLDRYKSKLKDMKSATEDFADDIEEVINNALLESLVNDEFKKRVKDLYMYIADHAGDGLDESELNFIRQENANIAEEMLARRQDLIDAGLLKPETEKYEQSASKGGWESMGEDTGQELNGRFTALQLAGEKISEGVAVMLTTMSTLSALADGRNITLTEIRNLMITNNAFLEDILSANKEYYKKFDSKLDKIVTQTK